MGSALSSLSSIGMAVGPPLVYADQFYSIIKRHDSTGFSKDVCAVLLFANITRCYFWLSSRFEVALLVQSLLMICAQFALLYVCIRYAIVEDAANIVRTDGPREALLEPGKGAQQKLLGQLQRGGPLVKRPFDFWQWPTYGTYLEWCAGYVIGLGVIYTILHSFDTFVDVLGFFALGLESTLPIPQLITNYRRKSLAGFRLTVLLGWLGGDAFKTVYFFLKDDNGVQFRVCAVFQLSIDCLIALQAYQYRHNTRLEQLALDDEEEAPPGGGGAEQV